MTNCLIFLFLALGADEQYIVGFGNDIIFQALDNHQLVAFHGNHVVGGIVEQCFAALSHVAVLVFGRVVIQGAPRTQVAPPEVGAEYEYVRRLLHDAEVDRDIGTGRKIGVDKILFGRCVEYLVVLLETVGDVGQEALEGLDDGLYIPDKYTRVPEKFAAFDKHFGKFEIRFFGKGLHRLDVAFGIFAYLYVAISRFGPVGFDAQGEQGRIFGHEFKPQIDAAGKLLFFENEVVGGCYHNVGIGVDGPYVISRPGNAGGRIASGRFQQDIGFGQFGQLFLDYIDIDFVRYDEDVVFGDYLHETVVAHL